MTLPWKATGCNSRPAAKAAIQGSKTVVLAVAVAVAVAVVAAVAVVVAVAVVPAVAVVVAIAIAGAVTCWIDPASSAAAGDKEGVGYGSNLEHVYGNSSGWASS